LQKTFSKGKDAKINGHFKQLGACKKQGLPHRAGLIEKKVWKNRKN
jgi:hypothetical protein